MSKSLDALLRGYVVYRVNDLTFWTYASANAYWKSISARSATFTGLHVFKDWRAFAMRVRNPTFVAPPSADHL